MTDFPRNDELVQAAGAGDLATVRRLIEAGADPNSVDRHGMGTLLNFHPEVTRYLLEHGANPDVQRNENIAPVLLGVCGNFECLRLLVEAGANVNRASEHNGETALHGVASCNDIEGVRLLLKHGAHPNARTKPGMKTYGLWRDARVRGETPLHRAAAWGSAEVIQALLDAGADRTVRDANKDTPLSWASWYLRDKSIIDMLMYDGAGVGPDFPPEGVSDVPS
ncbi:MAG: ankyrin repeat domain-containing protein [Planctomycetaceae bacterium]|nr:ankyrin repeat domain-containing protein [Planctomycetaceae bacterium]